MRAKLDAETLLQIILVLIVIWLVLAVLDATISLIGSIFAFPLTNLIGVLIVALIVLWLLDRI